MKRRNILVAIVLIMLALIMAIGLRGSTQTIQNLVMNFSGVQTAAVATFASNLTQTVAARPTSPPTLTPTSTPTLTLIDVNATRGQRNSDSLVLSLALDQRCERTGLYAHDARRNIHKIMAGVEQWNLRMATGFSICFLWR